VDICGRKWIDLDKKPVQFPHLPILKTAPTMKVTAILKGLIDLNGHQPIQIRINKGEKKSFKSTGIKVLPSLFENGKVSSRHPKAREWNEKISTMIIQYQAQALESQTKIKRMEFFQYLDKVIPTLQREPASIRQYNAQISKLKQYRSSFYADEIDKDFLDGYKAFLKKRGNSHNTIWSSFKFLNMFVKMAKLDYLMEENPFDRYAMPVYNEPHKEYLTEKEVADLEKFLKGNVSDVVRETGTWFLIGCYTGLRISDIKAFSKAKNIIGDRLVIKTQKTKEVVGLPISPRLKRYFERVEYKKLSIHENTYNKLIKVIAAAAGINKHISSHTARHTAAMLLANAGVSQEVTAAILGHKSLRHTATYYKIMNKRIDLELKKRK
jgi:integrase